MDRKKIVIGNSSLGLVFKVLSMGIVYLTIPYLLKYLGTDNYGIWVTIFSVINILFFVDAGIGNGLKTRLTEALSKKNNQLAKEYIGTAYGLIFGISILFLALGYLCIESISLSDLLQTEGIITEEKLKSLFFVALLFIVFNFVLSLYKTLFYAIHKAAAIEISVFFYQCIVLLLVLYAINNLESSLMNIVVFYGVVNIFVSVFFTAIFFWKRKNIIPSFHSFKRSRVKPLMGLSISFFVIQLCMIVIFTSDNLLISNFLGPTEVAKYDVVFKFFQILITLSIILLNPFWALFTDAYEKKDFKWIRRMLKKLNYLMLPLILVVLIVSFLTNDLIDFWVGEEFRASNLLIWLLGIFVLMRLYGAIYMIFLNGIGVVTRQMWLFVFGAVINIPLSFIFAKNMEMGSSGIILGTIVSLLGLTILMPIQVYKILRHDDAH